MAERRHRIEFLIDTSVVVNIRNVRGDSAEMWLAVTNAIVGGRLRTIRQVRDELESRFSDIATVLKRTKNNSFSRMM